MSSEKPSTEERDERRPLSRRATAAIAAGTILAGSLGASLLPGPDTEDVPTITSIDAATIGIDNPDALPEGVVQGGALVERQVTIDMSQVPTTEAPQQP
jgi:hypothetical protein